MAFLSTESHSQRMGTGCSWDLLVKRRKDASAAGGGGLVSCPFVHSLHTALLRPTECQALWVKWGIKPPGSLQGADRPGVETDKKQ